MVTPDSAWRWRLRLGDGLALLRAAGGEDRERGAGGLATSTARSTALAAVFDPSVPTRIFLYIGGEASARRRHVGSSYWSAGPASASSTGGGSKPSTARNTIAVLAGLGVGLGVDDDDLAGAELLVEEPLGQRVLDEALDGPAQRAGAERGVVAPVGQEQLGRRR